MGDRVKRRNVCYAEARYPDAWEDVVPAEFFTDRDAQQTMEMAGLVFAAVERRHGEASL
ncbi:MAG: hypothetical protein RMK57_04540 [Bryobacterales bacterium]|nr:hypothetical protein [Bryobacteraceae bacterium]MDW8353780.1 hypothetical protein [Bryobacterales bacterium]